jgi:hypothetical protein
MYSCYLDWLVQNVYVHVKLELQLMGGLSWRFAMDKVTLIAKQIFKTCSEREICTYIHSVALCHFLPNQSDARSRTYLACLALRFLTQLL